MSYHLRGKAWRQSVVAGSTYTLRGTKPYLTLTTIFLRLCDIPFLYDEDTIYAAFTPDWEELLAGMGMAWEHQPHARNNQCEELRGAEVA